MILFDKSTLSIEFLFKDDILLEEAKKWDYIYKKNQKIIHINLKIIKR